MTRLRARWMGAFLFLAFIIPGQQKSALALEIDPVSVNRLFEQHQPRPLPEGGTDALDLFESQQHFSLDSKTERNISIQIPGFHYFGCGKCHEGGKLAQGLAASIAHSVTTLEEFIPEARPVPVHQFIVQAYADDMLQRGQLAHATFDTIRMAAGAVLIDRHIYENQTLLHELLHLSQPFLGHVNELEAYGLNIRNNPRFLLLNYPYFQNVTQGYCLPNLPEIIQHWFGRDTDPQFSLPREAQWVMQPFDTGTLDSLTNAVDKIKPALDEASRLYRNHPYKIAYLSEQTGVRSLALDIAVVKTLGLPEATLSPEEIQKGLAAYADQMTRIDNTRLGYVIDRMQETSMTMKYTSGPKDEASRLALYFHYLKQRFFDEAGEIVLPIDDAEDFQNFIERKIKDLEKMAAWPNFTKIEKAGAETMVSELKKIPALSK